MDKQSSVYLLLLAVVAGIGGYLVHNKIVLGADMTEIVMEQGTLNSNVFKARTATADALTEEGKNGGDKTLPKKVTPKKYMNDSEVTTLDVQVTKEGAGAESKKGDVLSMNYTGRLLNGTTFDSNVDPAFGHVQPFVFPVGAGQVIKGWDQGLIGMKVGEKRILTIPADLAYGPYSPSPKIPANSALVFEVELLKIN